MHGRLHITLPVLLDVLPEVGNGSQRPPGSAERPKTAETSPIEHPPLGGRAVALGAVDRCGRRARDLRGRGLRHLRALRRSISNPGYLDRAEQQYRRIERRYREDDPAPTPTLAVQEEHARRKRALAEGDLISVAPVDGLAMGARVRPADSPDSRVVLVLIVGCNPRAPGVGVTGRWPPARPRRRLSRTRRCRRRSRGRPLGPPGGVSLQHDHVQHAGVRWRVPDGVGGGLQPSNRSSRRCR